MLALWIVKLLCVPLFLCVGTGFGMLPLAFRNMDAKKRDTFLALGNCFSGGVFLAVGFADLMVDAQATFRQNLGVELPVALTLCPAGFLLVFGIEKVLFLTSDGSGGHSHSHGHNHGG